MGLPVRFLLLFAVFIPTITVAQPTTLSARVAITRNGRAVKDASQVVVWLTPLTGITTVPHQSPSDIPRMVQKNKKFVPSLVVVPVGGKVEFPNHDPFFHNVFSMFEGKRFDLGLYESGTTQWVKFDKPGISYIFCNIHAQMSAVVVAVNTPYYAISNARGEVTLANVPPGRYRAEIFHPDVAPETLHTLTREITVNSHDNSIGLFQLAESDIEIAHHNKYGRDYDRPEPPDSPAYARP